MTPRQRHYVARHYEAVKCIHREGTLTTPGQLALWLPDELTWLAPRVMIHGLLRSDESNVSLAQQFKRFGVSSVSMTDDVLEYWAAHQIMHTIWDPEFHPNVTVLDAITVFAVLPGIDMRRENFRSEDEFEDMELTVGAYSIYCRHLEYLKRMRDSIERVLNAFFF